MYAFLALPPVRAKASQIETTERLAHVLLATARAERTEAFIVVRARGELGGGVNVQVEAFITVGTVEGARVVIAFGHAAPVDCQRFRGFHEKDWRVGLTDCIRANIRTHLPFCTDLSANACIPNY